MDNLVSFNLWSCIRYQLVELCVHIDSIPSSTDEAWGGIFTCSWENSIGRRCSLEERGGEYGETMLRCVSMCSTLMEELWRGILWPMGCWDAWPHQPARM